MAKNKFKPLQVLPNEGELCQLVSLFEYRRVYRQELPKPLNVHPLTERCNSFIVAASGHTHEIVTQLLAYGPIRVMLLTSIHLFFTTTIRNRQKTLGV